MSFSPSTGLRRQLWVLPLMIALLPFIATHIALLLSIEAGHVPGCVPYLTGCTSISRAARHGVAAEDRRTDMWTASCPAPGRGPAQDD